MGLPKIIWVPDTRTRGFSSIRADFRLLAGPSLRSAHRRRRMRGHDHCVFSMWRLNHDTPETGHCRAERGRDLPRYRRAECVGTSHRPGTKEQTGFSVGAGELKARFDERSTIRISSGTACWRSGPASRSRICRPSRAPTFATRASTVRSRTWSTCKRSSAESRGAACCRSRRRRGSRTAGRTSLNHRFERMGLCKDRRRTPYRVKHLLMAIVPRRAGYRALLGWLLFVLGTGSNIALRMAYDTRPVWAAVHVRWAPSIDDAGRQQLEQRYGLARGVFRGGRTWNYSLVDPSRTTIEALVRDPAVEDTDQIDRQAFRALETARATDVPPDPDIPLAYGSLSLSALIGAIVMGVAWSRVECPPACPGDRFSTRSGSLPSWSRDTCPSRGRCSGRVTSRTTSATPWR